MNSQKYKSLAIEFFQTARLFKAEGDSETYAFWLNVAKVRMSESKKLASVGL